jgi:hypothetical protein
MRVIAFGCYQHGHAGRFAREGCDSASTSNTAAEGN